MHYKCCEIAVYLVRMNGFYCRSQCGGGGGGGGDGRGSGAAAAATSGVLLQ